MERKLSLWTVYKNPTDYPGKFVARRFELDQPTTDFNVGDDIEPIRDWIFQEAIRFRQGSPFKMERSVNDDPIIYETWI